MQCELCSEPGTVRITDVEGGKATDRQLCARHAAEQLGGPTPEEWTAFIAQLAVKLEEHGSFPPVAEIAQLGELGNRMAKCCQNPHSRAVEFLQAEVQKHLAKT